MATPEQIGERMRAGYKVGPEGVRAALHEVVADEFEVVHIPSMPNDGVIKKDTLAEPLVDSDPFQQAIKGFHYEDISVEARDGLLVVAVTEVGVLPNGAPLKYKMRNL